MANPFAAIMDGFGGSSISNSIARVLPVIVMMGVLVGVVWFLLMWKRYNVEVEIYSPRANNTVTVIKDRGGFIKTKEGTEFRLLKQKVYVPSLTLEHVITSGKKNFLKLYEVDKGELLPVDIFVNKAGLNIKPEEGDIKEYRKQRFLKNFSQLQNKTPFEKIMPVLMIAVPAVLIIVLMYITLKDLGSISNTLAMAAKNIAAACGGGAPV